MLIIRIFLGIALPLGVAAAAPSPLDLRFSVNLSEAEQQNATVRIPRDLPAGQRVPALLVFGGFENAARVLDLIHPTQPIALATFDYPFDAPRKLRFPSSLSALPRAKRLFPLTVNGIADLVRKLRAMPEVDPDRVVVVGASFGAPFAVAAASSDPTIAGAVIVHGFGRVPETAAAVLLKSWRARLGRRLEWIARPTAAAAARLLWWYLGIRSPEELAAQLSPGQRVLMITAENDTVVPRQSSDSLWDAIRGSRATATREFMSGDHLMPGSDSLIHEIIHRTEAWMKDNRLATRVSQRRYPLAGRADPPRLEWNAGCSIPAQTQCRSTTPMLARGSRSSPTCWHDRAFHGS